MNNNKYYVIQVIKAGSKFYCHTRWGRVGEPGQSITKDCGPSQATAEKEFAKKFRDKTKNDWASVRANTANFSKVAGQYGLVEIDHEGDAAEAEAALSGVKAKAAAAPKSEKKVAASTLPAETQNLIKIVFDQDMFTDQLLRFEIDVKQLPLGKLNKNQIEKGFDVLERLEDAISRKATKEYEKLTSEFYTIIPHSFKRQRPPVISDKETVQQKNDMLNVLNDIEIAQSLTEKDEKKKAKKNDEDEVELPNPLDANYGLLGAEVTPLAKSDKNYKLIETYFNNTKTGYGRKVDLEGIFEVNRKGEDARFKAHDKLGNRKLLWHGTNVAVIVAILNTGLRIMPHSGGRVGKGMYFASESGKSASYVACNAKGEGFMFLTEVALGKEHHITMDDSSLKTPPKGFDCIIAQGRTEPDHSKAETVKLGGKDVVMAMGPPLVRAEYKNSNFSQSEYLVYQENQVRIRYLLKLKFPVGYW